METLYFLTDLFLHLDRHLQTLFLEYGTGIYLILFLIIFCETGLVVAPFLPGDSLLFAAGALLAGGAASLESAFGLVILLSIAAILGDGVNYIIGARMGRQILDGGGWRYLNRNHLDRAQHFYEQHGGKTIVLARFLPIIRTFAPFVAGCGKMDYRRFAAYNIIGGIVWVSLFILAGYFFGNLPIVKNNFKIVILAIIFISILPVIIEFAKKRT
ncbi:MAG: DedA family protein [Nitrospirota bacterium]